MFSSKLIQRATCAATTSSSAAAAHRTTACLASRRPHQRRPSSSKASCPPDSSASGTKPAPTAKASNAAASEGKAPIPRPAPQQQGAKRVARSKRSKDESEDQFASLPAVPTTQHLSPSELSVSSFFSLHRPIAPKYTIPPISSSEVFDSIFESRKPVDPWENGNSAEGRPEDVVYALGDLFENLEHGSGESQDDGVRWEVIQESTSNHDGVRHLDGPPRAKTMDELVAEFKPFNAPPPPQPFPDETKAAPKKKASKAKQKSFETTIIVTEHTSETGRRTYTATSSPIVSIPGPGDLSVLEEPLSEGTEIRWPHRGRRFERSRAYWTRFNESMRDMPSVRRRKLNMYLISVKRQRKLKMKKHKYKKLMKRTRNLRRRQDRA